MNEPNSSEEEKTFTCGSLVFEKVEDGGVKTHEGLSRRWRTVPTGNHLQECVDGGWRDDDCPDEYYDGLYKQALRALVGPPLWEIKSATKRLDEQAIANIYVNFMKNIEKAIQDIAYECMAESSDKSEKSGISEKAVGETYMVGAPEASPWKVVSSTLWTVIEIQPGDCLDVGDFVDMEGSYWTVRRVEGGKARICRPLEEGEST